jgi:hypothetical protein
MVATELAVFRLGETRGSEAGVCSLEALLESHENGLVSFRPNGAGASGAAGATGAGAVFVGESICGGGDQGIAGNALVMLLKDLVLDVSFSTGGLLSRL